MSSLKAAIQEFQAASAFGVSITALEKGVRTLAKTYEAKGLEVEIDVFKAGPGSRDASYVELKVVANSGLPEEDYAEVKFISGGYHANKNEIGSDGGWKAMKAKAEASIKKQFGREVREDQAQRVLTAWYGMDSHDWRDTAVDWAKDALDDALLALPRGLRNALGRSEAFDYKVLPERVEAWREVEGPDVGIVRLTVIRTKDVGPDGWEGHDYSTCSFDSTHSWMPDGKWSGWVGGEGKQLNKILLAAKAAFVRYTAKVEGADDDVEAAAKTWNDWEY